LVLCAWVTACHPRPEAQRGEPANCAKADDDERAIEATAGDTVESCTAAIRSLMSLRNRCPAPSDEGHRQIFTRLVARLKVLEHEAYARERMKLDLSDSEARSLAPCDADLWNSDIDATPFCWHGLALVEISKFARSKAQCVDTRECVILPGLDCTAQLVANRKYEKQIADRISELWTTLHAKRLVDVKCRAPMVERVECVRNECVAHWPTE
jgi:hypothetical protein